MDRRTYLRSIGVAGIATAAGCLESVPGAGGGDENSETTLGPPEESYDLPHPGHGEAMPSFSLPDPLTGEEISTADLEGDRPYLITFFFTSCPDGACPALLLRLRRVQEDARERGYDDDIALLALTFDPERDTEDVLREYADEQGVDLEAGNWHFLRPEEFEEGQSLLEDELGMVVQKVDDEEHAEAVAGDDGSDADDDHDDHDDGGDHDDHNGDDHDDHDGHDDGGDDDDHTHDDDDGGNDDGEHEDDDGEHDDHDHGEYTLTHNNVIFLVNDQAIVERMYPRGTVVEAGEVVDDVRAVVE